MVDKLDEKVIGKNTFTTQKHLTRRSSTSSLRRLSTLSVNGVSRFIRRKSSFFATTITKAATRSFGGTIGLPIEEVRKNVLSIITNDIEANCKYDQCDIEKIKNNDWFVQRFITEHYDDIYAEDEDVIEKSVKSIIECISWRFTSGVNHLTSLNFPSEFYSAGIITLGKDSMGDPVIYIRGKFFKSNIQQWSQLLKVFISCYYELMDKKLNGNMAIIVIDMTGCGVRTFDLQHHLHLSDLIGKYYPNSCTKLYINEVSWLMKPGLSILLKFAPLKYQEIVQFTTTRKLTQILGSQNLPAFLGGTAKVELVVPSNVSPIEDIANKYGLPLESINSLREALNNQ